MHRLIRNYGLDVFLCFLLCLNAASLVRIRPMSPTSPPDLEWHVHILSGGVLLIGCVIHITLHRRGLKAAAREQPGGAIKLAMKSLLAFLILSAALTGPLADRSTAGRVIHGLTGAVSLLGLLVHAVQHLRWIVLMTRRYLPPQKNANGASPGMRG